MKVLLVSGAVSNRLQLEMYDNYHLPLHFAIQKYYKLVEEGFARDGMDIEAQSIVPIPNAKAPFRIRRFKKEKERNVTYHYVPFVRMAVINQAVILFCLLWRVFFWSLRNRKDGVVLCDTLIPSVCIGTFLGSSIAGGKRIAWVTDMPGMTSTKCVHYEEMGFLGKLQIRCIHNYSGFVFTTKQTNNVLNPNNHPYIVMEGLVDPEIETNSSEKAITRNILYAGGLFEEYGIGLLCRAFMRLPFSDIRLVIYGDGPYNDRVEEYMSLDQRIEFRGTAANNVIVDEEKKARLLINPRLTGAEYTYYSYPSKNIEYMVSGTPTITTRLAGIPSDHDPYLYFVEEESEDGLYKALFSLLSKPNEELDEFGLRAQSYIKTRKNADVQARRIIDLMHSL